VGADSTPASIRPTSSTRATSTTTSRASTTTTSPATSITTSRASTTTTSRASTTTTPVVEPRRVLIFSRTTGYRHPSIVDGVAAMRELALSAGFAVTASEDPARFTDAELARYDAVAFLSTSGDVLDGSQEAAFERYIEGGGGWVGVHAASDTEYGWPWYGRLVGTWFANHPLVPNDRFDDCHCFTADVHRSASHLSTDHLPPVWSRRDEWYNFRSPIPATATVLLAVDESTYPGGTMGSPHPVTWSQSIGRGRSWYTAMGHTADSFRDPAFRSHLRGGLVWAAGG
jgi:type 1 glutamine amidotransferase